MANLPDAVRSEAGLDASTAAPCPGALQQKAAFFTRRPADGTNDNALVDVLVGLLDCAPAGSEVRASIYRINLPRVADAFVRANERGVDVRLIVDWDNRDANGNFDPAVQTIADSLGARFLACGSASGGSCIGTHINHNKFAVFSALDDGSRDVVMQSSSNMTRGQRSLHNNTVVVRDDAALHDAYVSYWNDLWAQQKNPSYFQGFVDGDTNTRIYVSPRATGDTVANVLGNMSCASGGTLRVAMSLFHEERAEVVSRLVEMQNTGCTLALVLRGDAEAPVTVLDDLDAAGIPYIQYPLRTDGWNVHSKYWMWEGAYGSSSATRRIVFTGSHNWNENALRNNDETILRVEDDGIYAAFLADFETLLIEATTP